jgi:hypothetical protein
LAHHKKKKLKLWWLPKIEIFYGKMEFLPLSPTYIGEKGRTWAKHMGSKRGNIGNALGEHIGNALEEHIGNLGKKWKICCELEGNILGTKEKWKKNQGTLSAC